MSAMPSLLPPKSTNIVSLLTFNTFPETLSPGKSLRPPVSVLAFKSSSKLFSPFMSLSIITPLPQHLISLLLPAATQINIITDFLNQKKEFPNLDLNELKKGQEVTVEYTKE